MADVFETLVAEHRILERLLGELADGHDQSRSDVVVGRLTSVLCAHLAFEEVALRPLFGPLADDLATAATGEHHRALDGLARLNEAITASRPDAFEAAVATLGAEIASHVDHDERDLFPHLRAICDQPTIDSLSERLDAMLQQIDTRPWHSA